MDHLIEQFRARSWTTIDLDSQQYISEIIPLFTQLLARPPAAPFGLPYDNPNDIDTGLFYRDGKISRDGTPYDRKAVFHYRRGIEAAIAAVNPQFLVDHAALFAACGRLHTLCEQKSREFLQAFNRVVLPQHPFILDPSALVLRLLAYTEIREDSSDTERMIGQPHIDRDSFTLALYESHPGLEFKDKRGRWHRMSSKPNEPIIFTGAKLQQETRDLPAMWHQVRWLDEGNRVSDQIIRLAVVCFAHHHGVQLTLPTHL